MAVKLMVGSGDRAARYLGAWASGTAYKAGSIVTSSGVTYFAAVDVASRVSFYEPDWVAVYTNGFRGTWATGIQYYATELVVNGNGLYRCTTTHVSGASFDATKFAAIAAATLAGLSDLDLTGLAVGDTLAWDGGDWVPSQSGQLYKSLAGPFAPTTTSYVDVSGSSITIPNVPAGSSLWIMVQSTMVVTSSSVQLALNVDNGIGTTQMLSSTATSAETRFSLSANTSGTLSRINASHSIISVDTAADYTAKLMMKAGATSNGASLTNLFLRILVVPGIAA